MDRSLKDSAGKFVDCDDAPFVPAGEDTFNSTGAGGVKSPAIA
jgi:hypothetical protein